MPEIQIPDISAKLRRFFSIKGGGEIASLAPEIVPVTLVADLASVTDAPEAQIGRDVFLWAAARGLTGGSGATYASAQIGSNDEYPETVTVITHCEARVSGATWINLRLCSDALLNPQRALRVDMRSHRDTSLWATSAPPLNAKTISTVEAGVGPGTATGREIGQFYMTDTLARSIEQVRGIVLSRDTYLRLAVLTIDVSLQVNFRGYEFVPTDQRRYA